MHGLHVCIASLLLLASGSAAAQGMPVSTDGTDPKTWAPGLDAIQAAKGWYDGEAYREARQPRGHCARDVTFLLVPGIT